MPTLPLSGGKLNTVMASFFSATFFFARLQAQRSGIMPTFA